MSMMSISGISLHVIVTRHLIKRNKNNNTNKTTYEMKCRIKNRRPFLTRFNPNPIPVEIYRYDLIKQTRVYNPDNEAYSSESKSIIIQPSRQDYPKPCERLKRPKNAIALRLL